MNFCRFVYFFVFLKESMTMAGTKAGGQKAAATKHDTVQTFKIGAKGG